MKAAGEGEMRLLKEKYYKMVGKVILNVPPFYCLTGAFSMVKGLRKGREKNVQSWLGRERYSM